MFRHLALVSVLAGGLATAGFASAPGAAPGMAWLKGHDAADTPLGRLVTGSAGRLLVLRSELNLTTEQRSQIREVLVTHRAQIAQTVKSVYEKRNVLRDAVLQGQSEDQIRAAAGELGTAIGEASVKAAKLRNQVAPILTEHQQKRIGQFIADQDQAVGKFLDQASQQP
jgi:Spy/CpxP family protein refolding chaperone